MEFFSLWLVFLLFCISNWTGRKDFISDAFYSSTYFLPSVSLRRVASSFPSSTSFQLYRFESCTGKEKSWSVLFNQKKKKDKDDGPPPTSTTDASSGSEAKGKKKKKVKAPNPRPPDYQDEYEDEEEESEGPNTKDLSEDEYFDFLVTGQKPVKKSSPKATKKFSPEELQRRKHHTIIWRYLKRDLNMPSTDAKAIFRMYPWLFEMDYDNIIKPYTELLKKNYEFRNYCLRAIVFTNPFIFQKSINETIERLELIKTAFGFTNQNLYHVVENQPLLLSLSLEEIQNILDFFTKVVEFNKKQLKIFFKCQFRVWITPLQYLKDYYGKLRALNYSPEDIQKRLLSNLEIQKKFYFKQDLVDGYDPRYLTEFLD